MIYVFFNEWLLILMLCMMVLYINKLSAAAAAAEGVCGRSNNFFPSWLKWVSFVTCLLYLLILPYNWCYSHQNRVGSGEGGRGGRVAQKEVSVADPLSLFTFILSRKSTGLVFPQSMKEKQLTGCLVEGNWKKVFLLISCVWRLKTA